MAYIGQNAEGNFTTTNAKDRFSGDGSTTTFTLSQRGTENNVDVFVNNVRQEPGVAYNIEGNGTSLVFTAAPSTGTNNIYVVNRGPAELSASHPAAQSLEAVDGTFTGDLTVDTDTLYVDSTNNRVGVGTDNPTQQLTLHTDSSGTPALRLNGHGNNSANKSLGDIEFFNRDTSGDGPQVAALIQAKSGSTTGSSGQIIFSTAKSNTGVEGADPLERVRIDEDGNVGIGTNSPDSYDSRANNLVVGDSGDAGITIFSGSTSNARLQFAPSGATGLDDGLIDYDNNDDSMSFATGGTERLRITSNQVRLNPTELNQEGGYLAWGDDSEQDQTYIYARNNADTSPVFQAEVGNVLRAEIESDGSFHSSVNSYNGFSDQNYKENIALSGSQWDDIKAIQVKKYSWIHDNLDAPNQIGVIAQDLEASGMSGLVTNHTKKKFDADGNEVVVNDDDGNPITYKSVKYSVLYMKAIKALQEAMTKIETLETKVATLETENADFETRLTALEATD